MRKEFQRVDPEDVGIPSASIEALLDKLEEGWVEPHGLMIMRYGKVCAEGWWAPYGAGVRHRLQSHTKTYDATAIGIAYTEGLLTLSDPIIEIFPEAAPAAPSENLRKLTIRDVLCMGCGMDTMPHPTKEWIRDFLAVPVNHAPGTAFMYNTIGSALLSAIVRKKSGMTLQEYLTPRLFKKIGIDAENLRWSPMPDGTEFSLFATTEDNLRLMKLYADGGVWDGERILAEDFVRLATTKQNDSASERTVNPPAEDNFVGYGFQIWMCRPNGVYRADGAMGQFTIVIPNRNMILAITENASGTTGGAVPQRVLDTIWAWLDDLPDAVIQVLPKDPAASTHLARRMRMLSLPAPLRSPESLTQEKINGSTYAVREGTFALLNSGMSDLIPGASAPIPVQTVAFRFENNMCIITCMENGRAVSLTAAMDGTRVRNDLPETPSIALCSGLWISDKSFEITMRLLETCNERKILFTFDGDFAQVESSTNNVFAHGSVKAHLVRI